MKKGNRIGRIWAWLFLAVFLGYFTDTTFFTHRHILEGRILVHSHLHKESHHSGGTGNHTKNSLLLIDQLSHFDSPGAEPSPGQEVIVPFTAAQEPAPQYPGWKSAPIDQASLRAPPVF